jgi:hypothetical protein
MHSLFISWNSDLIFTDTSASQFWYWMIIEIPLLFHSVHNILFILAMWMGGCQKFLLKFKVYRYLLIDLFLLLTCVGSIATLVVYAIARNYVETNPNLS